MLIYGLDSGISIQWFLLILAGLERQLHKFPRANLAKGAAVGGDLTDSAQLSRQRHHTCPEASRKIELPLRSHNFPDPLNSKRSKHQVVQVLFRGFHGALWRGFVQFLPLCGSRGKPHRHSLPHRPRWMTMVYSLEP